MYIYGCKDTNNFFYMGKLSFESAIFLVKYQSLCLA